MENKKIGKLTRNERMILEAMWKADAPLTRSGILNHMAGTFKENSFYNYLNSLLEKGLVQVDDVVRTGKTYGRTYLPAVTREDYHLMQMEELGQAINPSEETLVSFIINMIETQELSQESMKELKAALTRKMQEA